MTSTGVHLVAGSGSQRLILRFDITASWLVGHEAPSDVAPTLISGTAWTSMPGPLRALAGFQPRVMTVRGWPVDGDLSFDLSDDALAALDRASNGSDIEINLKLEATLLRTEDVIHPVMCQEVNVRIARTRWIELLDGVGAGVGITLRIPSPLTEAGAPAGAADAETTKSLAQAAARLRKARQQLRDGDWEECVATCRKVLENVDSLGSITNAATVKAINPQDRTKDERWAAAFHDLNSLASAAHHESAKTSWTRVDAEALLACTAALLLRYTAR